MALLVVGSIAFDSIHAPTGSVEDALGGSASFFSYVSSFFTQPRLVGVVGKDFPEEHVELFKSRKIDTAGLVREEGDTFRWKGRYHEDMNSRDTLEVHLNVFEHFQPELPQAFRSSEYVFLANASPITQAKTLDQIDNPKMVLADTMDLWINIQHDELVALLKRIDGLLLNDGEARLLTEEPNLVRAGRKILDMGPKFVILKKGEHGAMLISKDEMFVVPAFPTEQVLDPTGAGDSFAGGVLGYLASEDASKSPKARLRTSMAYGTVVASLTVEGFGLDRLRKTTREQIDTRLEQYRQMMTF